MKIMVFASFTPKPGAEAEVERILRGMVISTRSEPGNLTYDLFRADAGAESFHIFEAYRDEAALEAHRTSDHYKAYRAVIGAHLAEPIGVKVLRGLDVA